MSFKIDFDVESANAKVKTVEQTLDRMVKKTQTVSQELQKMAKAADGDSDAMAKLKREVSASEKEMAKLKKQIAQTEKPLSDQAKASKRSAQEAAALRAALNAAGTHMGIFTGQTILTAAAVYSLVSALKSVIVVGTEFTGSMVKANAIMGATEGEAAVLEREVRRLGETTVFTATEAAGGLTALAMAGLSTGEALDALGPALSLAVIGQIDMYKSADILTNVMNGFRLEAEDIPSIVDDLATAITTSNATIEQMGNALSYVAPVAAAAGAEISEVVAILEVFHNAGIKASRAGTSLRRAYSNLLKPSSEAKDILEELGVATKDVNGRMYDLSSIMEDLGTSGATSADLIALFGIRALPAMEALMADMKGVNSEFKLFYGNLKNNEGAAKGLRDSFEEYLGADTRKLMSALQEQSITLFEGMEEPLRNAVQGMTKFVQAFDIDRVREFHTSINEFISDYMDFVGTVVGYTPVGLLFSSESEQAVQTIQDLTAEEKKLQQQRELSAAAGKKIADAAVQFEQRGQDSGLDKVQKDYISKITKLDEKRKEYALGIGHLATEILKNPELASGVSAQSKAIARLRSMYDEASVHIGEVSEKLQRYMVTGLDDQGVQLLDRHYNALEKLSTLSFSQQAANELNELGAELQNIVKLDSNGQISAAEALLGSEERIDKAADHLKVTYESKIAPLMEKLSKYDPTKQGEHADSARYISTLEKIITLGNEYRKTQITMSAALDKTSAGFSAYAAEGDKLNTTAEANLHVLQSQIDKVKGIASSHKTAAQMKLEHRVADLSLNIAILEGQEGQEDRVKALKEQLLTTTDLIARTKALRDELEQAKVQEKLKKDFAAGKYLSEDDQAQLEHSKGLAQLEAYQLLNQGKLENDNWYADAKLELDQKLIESQNEVWFSAAENMSKTVGDNIAKAAMMEQSWGKTTENIKKAIIGGFIGTLVQVGVQMAANALLHKIFATEEMATETAVAAVKVGAEATKATAVGVTATAETTAAATSTAGILATLVPAGVAVAAAWTPAAMMVSLATFGANAVPAMAGMATTAALAATLSLVTSAVGGISGGVSGTREIGGPVMAGQSYLVGEKGAEIFTPTTGGAITSNADVKRSMGGGGGDVHKHYYDQTSNNVTIKALDTQDVRQALAKESNFLHGLNQKENNRRGKR